MPSQLCHPGAPSHLLRFGFPPFDQFTMLYPMWPHHCPSSGSLLVLLTLGIIVTAGSINGSVWGPSTVPPNPFGWLSPWPQLFGLTHIQYSAGYSKEMLCRCAKSSLCSFLLSSTWKCSHPGLPRLCFFNSRILPGFAHVSSPRPYRSLKSSLWGNCTVHQIVSYILEITALRYPSPLS